MTVHDEWTDQLSDYLDGELSAGERDAVETHLAICAPCAAVLNDLTRVVADARNADARPPQADLWSVIAGRIEARPAPRRIAFTLPQLAAAAALLMAVSGGLAWEVSQRAGRPEGLRDASTVAGSAEAPAAAADSPATVAQPSRAAGADMTTARVETVGMADAQYDAAVLDLEKALQAGRGHLDASTIAIVEHNLQIIDQAISQAREALVADPANSYLSSHLVEARRRKLDLLRRATALATETN